MPTGDFSLVATDLRDRIARAQLLTTLTLCDLVGCRLLLPHELLDRLELVQVIIRRGARGHISVVRGHDIRLGFLTWRERAAVTEAEGRAGDMVGTYSGLSGSSTARGCSGARPPPS